MTVEEFSEQLINDFKNTNTTTEVISYEYKNGDGHPGHWLKVVCRFKGSDSNSWLHVFYNGSRVEWY